MAQGTSLSADAIIQSLGQQFEKVRDFRDPLRIEYSMRDCLMSAFAIFHLKFPSLLNFEIEMKKKRNFSNLQSLFKVDGIPSDTRMREVVDEVDPEDLRPSFKSLFARAQSANVLKEFKSIQSSYLLAIDATGYFSSDAVNCHHCLTRKVNEDDKLYHHQAMSAAIVHPDKRHVIPICPEPIRKQDGETKNDSERSSAKRLLIKYREDHPKLKTIVLADALHSTLPMIADLERLQMNFVMSVKPGSHETLFNGISYREKANELRKVVKEEIIGEKVKKTLRREYTFTNGILLRAADVTKTVNFLDIIETLSWTMKKGGVETPIVKRVHYSWITDLSIYDSNCEELSRIGRTRWKIENETFNTLKNQGYEFEHNFGHGKRHLSTNLIYLMMLAFLSDQLQAMGCPNFKSAYREAGQTLIRLWEYIKSLYSYFPVQLRSFEMLFGIMFEPEKWGTWVDKERTPS